MSIHYEAWQDYLYRACYGSRKGRVKIDVDLLRAAQAFCFETQDIGETVSEEEEIRTEHEDMTKAARDGRLAKREPWRRRYSLDVWRMILEPLAKSIAQGDPEFLRRMADAVEKVGVIPTRPETADDRIRAFLATKLVKVDLKRVRPAKGIARAYRISVRQVIIPTKGSAIRMLEEAGLDCDPKTVLNILNELKDLGAKTR